MDMIKVLFRSKKFTAMIIGIVATFLSTRFNLPEEQVREIVALVIAYIIGQGVADMGKQTTKT